MRCVTATEGAAMALVRVQVLIDDEENEALSCEARRLGVSRSEVVRRALRPLAAREAEERETDPFFATIGMLAGEKATDLSMHHDDYLYRGRR
jgi:metal-responsive CopG/Arc/MetJ family transcriptional regulator